VAVRVYETGAAQVDGTTFTDWFVGQAEKLGAVQVAVPCTAKSYGCSLQSLLLTFTVAEARPVADGVNFTTKVVVPPLAATLPAGAVIRVKAADPTIFTLETVSGKVGWLFVMVKVRVKLPPIRTFPKSVWSLSAGAISPSIMALPLPLISISPAEPKSTVAVPLPLPKQPPALVMDVIVNEFVAGPATVTFNGLMPVAATLCELLSERTTVNGATPAVMFKSIKAVVVPGQTKNVPLKVAAGKAFTEMAWSAVAVQPLASVTCTV